ncbi:MAG: dioxygenase [Chloroflexota bacterium]
MSYVTKENLMQIVLDAVNADNDRFREIFESLTRHIHAFVDEVNLTQEEWFFAIDFLTRTGQMCDEDRQEFVLLSDMFGLSALVDLRNNEGISSATESAVLGPFHAKALPMPMGAMIARGDEAKRGDEAFICGTVLDGDGNPIRGAMLDVWHADDIGFYDVQDEKQPDHNLRGIFTTGEDGKYWFRTIKPSPYPVPTDGPVGELLDALGKHAMRPAHLHFKINAPGFEELVTQIYSSDSKYLDTDAVFGVKESLIAQYTPNNSAEEAAKHNFRTPFYEVNFDFVMTKGE